MRKKPVDDAKLIRVAKIASLVIALFSFAAAPLLQYAPEGLWQIIRIFTGFYNIPVITLVLVGLFTKRVPALAAKVAVGFHVIAYALLQFVFDSGINFIDIYALLFVAEVVIMLTIGGFSPRPEPWSYTERSVVDMTPWRYAVPTSIISRYGNRVDLLVVLTDRLGWWDRVPVLDGCDRIGRCLGRALFLE